jgi:hypothetical protein
MNTDFYIDFSLTRDERLTLLKGLWDQQAKIKADISELEALGSDWTKDEIIKLKGKFEELYKLQIKLEG